MLVFYSPFKPKKPEVVEVVEDLTAEDKAREEAARRARAEAQQGRRASLASGGAGAPLTQRKSLLGIG